MSVVDTLLSTQPRQVVALPLEQVRPAVDNVRSDLGDVTSLAASIESTGLLQPIVVYPPVEGDVEGMHEIVAGHRRYAAHQLLGKPTIDAIVAPWPDDDAASTAARIIENVQREDLTVLDEARAYASLADAPFSWTQRQIAEAVGVNQSHVSKRIKLAALPDPVLEAIGAGECRIEDALTLGTLLEEDPQRGATVVAKKRYRFVDHQLADARREAKRQQVIAEVKAKHAAGDGPPLHPASESDDPPWSSYSARGVVAADHYQFRDAKVSPARMLADGNLAVLVCRDSTIEEVCTDPAAYMPKTKPKPKPRPFEVAKEARQAFIGKLLSDPEREPPAAHEALIELLLTVALPRLNGADLHGVCTYLGLDINKSAGYRDCLELLEGMLAGGAPRTNAQVVTARRIAEAVAIGHAEDRLHGYSDQTGARPDQVAHLRRLEAAGHELHKAELDWLANAEDDDPAPCQDCGQLHETVDEAMERDTAIEEGPAT